MISDAERMRLNKLFSDTISLLCRSGLPIGSALRVDALIGITLDDREVVLVNVNENFLSENVCRGGNEGNEQSLEPSRMAEKFPASSQECSKNELEASSSQNVSKTSEVVPGMSNETDMQMTPNFHLDFQSQGLSSNVRDTCADSLDNEGCENNNALQKFENSSAAKSDSDCVFVKMESCESEMNNALCDSDENFFTANPDGIAVSSVPIFHRPVYGNSSLRPNQLYSMQRCMQRRSSGTRLHKPREKDNSAEVTASDHSQVVPYSSSTFMPSSCGQPAGETEKYSAADRAALERASLVQCYICGSWLRGRQTLNDHIRGKHMSIYNYHCQYCGLSFKWRSAHRTHQLNCLAANTANTSG